MAHIPGSWSLETPFLGWTSLWAPSSSRCSSCPSVAAGTHSPSSAPPLVSSGPPWRHSAWWIRSLLLLSAHRSRVNPVVLHPAACFEFSKIKSLNMNGKKSSCLYTGKLRCSKNLSFTLPTGLTAKVYSTQQHKSHNTWDNPSVITSQRHQTTPVFCCCFFFTFSSRSLLVMRISSAQPTSLSLFSPRPSLSWIFHSRMEASSPTVIRYWSS